MRYITQAKQERGDTLIEVLVAIAILGALITISFAVMSRGFATAQNSLDRTQTQALLSGQASLLRAAHDRAVNDDSSYWNTIVANTVNRLPAELDETKLPDGCSTALVGTQRIKTFYMDPVAIYDSANTAPTGPLVAKAYYAVQPSDDSKLIRQSGVPVLGDGIWIEGYKDANSFYTFYIKSCWRATYGDGTSSLRQAKTVVRLYAP